MVAPACEDSYSLDISRETAAVSGADGSLDGSSGTATPADPAPPRWPPPATTGGGDGVQGVAAVAAKAAMPSPRPGRALIVAATECEKATTPGTEMVAAREPCSPLPPLVTCDICFESVPAGHMGAVASCGHPYCRECLSAHWSASVCGRASLTPTCPRPGCHAPATDADILAAGGGAAATAAGMSAGATAAVAEATTRRLGELRRAAVTAGDHSAAWCAVPSCGARLPVLPGLRGGGGTIRYCAACGHHTCRICGETHRPGGACRRGDCSEDRLGRAVAAASAETPQRLEAEGTPALVATGSRSGDPRGAAADMCPTGTHRDSGGTEAAKAFTMGVTPGPACPSGSPIVTAGRRVDCFYLAWQKGVATTVDVVRWLGDAAAAVVGGISCAWLCLMGWLDGVSADALQEGEIV